MGFDKKYKMGSDESIRNFSRQITQELSQYTTDGIGPVMEEFLGSVKNSMEEYVPEDTSATKESWFQEVSKEQGKVVGTFGHDKNGELEYVPFIYLGQNTEGHSINFRNGKIPFWLEPSVRDNLPELKRKLSKSGGNNG